MRVDKKEAIMNAALEVFSELGFHGAPAPLIAEKADVGVGTIYRYFRDKEDLVNELYRFWKIKFMEALREDLDENKPLRALFHEIWSRWLQFALNYPKAFLFLTFHYHAPYLDEETRKLTDRLHEEYLAIFEQGRRDQIFKDVPAAALMATALGMGAEIMREYWAGRFELTEELINDLEEMCWQALRR